MTSIRRFAKRLAFKNAGVALSHAVGCLHLLWFASFGSRFTVRPRKPRKACLPLGADGLSFRSGSCVGTASCTTRDLRAFLCRLVQKPIFLGTTFERQHTRAAD